MKMKINKKGFTLIELIVVVTIIGVLAMILVPSMMGYIKRSRRLSDISTARVIRNDASAVLAEEGEAQDSFFASIGVETSVNATFADNSENYNIDIVAKRKVGYTQWEALGSGSQEFVDELNSMQENSISLKFTPKECTSRLDSWFIAKRTDLNGKIEVWAGSSSTPIYRVWPETDQNY